MTIKHCLLVPLLLSAVVVHSAPELDHGGKSLDFGKFQIPKRDETGIIGKNLIVNGNFELENEKSAGRQIGKNWRTMPLIWSKNTELRKKILPLMSVAVENVSGEQKHVLVIDHKPDITSHLDNEGKPMLATYSTQNISLASVDKPVEYLFKMKVKGNYGSLSISRTVLLLCNFKDGSGKKAKNTGKSLLRRFSVVQGKWQDVSTKVTIPPGTRVCEITVSLYGVGKFMFDDISFAKAKEEKTAKVKIYPMYLFDNMAYLGQGQANVIKFGLANQRWKNTKNVKLHVILPDGIRAIASSYRGKLSESRKVDGGKTEYVFDIGADPIAKDNYFTRSPNVIVDVTAPASDRDMEGTCYLSCNGDKGEIEHFKMRIVPSFKSRSPKNFYSGMCDLNSDLFFYDGKAAAYADFYRNAGMNILHGYDRVNYKNVLWDELHGKYGLKRAATVRWAANGCRFGYKGGVPDEIAFLDIEGKPFKDRIQYSFVCPTVVYKKDPRFLAIMQPILARELKNLEMVLPNWEPYMLDGRGCFCSRCGEEFIQFTKSKLKEAEIRKNWPKKVAVIYPEIWKKFRSFQHGNVVRTMEKLVADTGRKMGKDIHFVPEIQYDTVTENGNAGSFAKEYDPVNYLSDLPWLAPWGPYLYTDTRNIYQYYPGKNIAQLFALENVTHFITKHCRNGNAPKLMSMPGGGWDGVMSEPEALAMDMVSAFVAGFDGATPWTFPFGCDYRWWRAMAKANDMIARNEDIVSKGSKVPGIVTLKPQTRLPRFQLSDVLNKLLPDLKGQSIVQHRAFRKGNITVVAVANFWAKGECYFTLAIRDLPAGNYVVTDQNDIFYGTFTHTELKKGILLQAGALRWMFFRFEKDGAAGKDLISQAQVRQNMEKFRKSLEDAARKDDAHSAAIEAEEARFNRKNSLSGIRDIRSGNVALKVEGQYLRISTPEYSLLLAPDEGGKILECVSGKDALVKKGAGHLGQDGFWGPRAATMSLTGSYRLTECRAVKDGIEVGLEYEIRRENRFLDGLKVRKIYRFEKDGFLTAVTVKNGSDQERTFRFRFHNEPGYLRNPEGVYQIGQKTFERTFNVNMYRFGKPDVDVENLLRGTGTVKDLAPGVILLRPDRKSSAWKMDFSVEKAQAVVFWDTLKGSTAEVIFRKVTLKPGKSENFTVNWRKQSN